MASKRLPVKKPRELPDKAVELPEVALAAIASYKKQKEVGDFINFLLAALDRNSNWLNTIVGRQNNFKCVLMVGAGPNRFQLQEVIYPPGGSDIKLEVELKDSEDHDKIAIAALVKLTNIELEHLLKYLKTRLCENTMLREDLLKGKALGVSFAVLRPFCDKQYRVMERIVIGSSMKCLTPIIKKRRRDEKILVEPPFKKTRKVT
ncbi:hypothetical protein HF086_012077 [Spodoptera exigua]|uniref:Uncharacterized protein n=1 Tax=Spodoptera exigua TaxID=7107 RepID=A0A922MJA1_SPOEX|nr:hypothetical protein HF086_012077 [Spodoptera exigua]